MAQLRDPISREWNMAKLNELFEEQEVRQICYMPSGINGRKDFLAWKFTKDGIYSTRSGYVDILRPQQSGDLPLRRPQY